MFIRQTALIIAAAVALAGCDKPMSTGEKGAIAGGALGTGIGLVISKRLVDAITLAWVVVSPPSAARCNSI